MTDTPPHDRGCSETHRDYETAIEFAKFRARIILNSTNRKIIIPSHEEMVGFYALERDDQLPPLQPARPQS